MTQFIELTDFGIQHGTPNKFDVNISSIETFHESLINTQTLIYVTGKSYYVLESRQQIRDLIQQAQSPQPYQTK